MHSASEGLIGLLAILPGQALSPLVMISCYSIIAMLTGISTAKLASAMRGGDQLIKTAQAAPKTPTNTAHLLCLLR